MSADLISVVSVRGMKPVTAPKDLIYIGRRSGGWPAATLANPYKLPYESQLQREAVKQQYRLWLWERMKANDSAVIAELDRIAAKVAAGETVQLGYWCSPLPCHGDVIRAAVLGRIR